MQEEPILVNQEDNASPTSEEKLWMILSHVSLLLGVGLVLPLVVYLVKKDTSPLVAHHAKEALNFQISVVLYSLACVLLSFFIVGFFLMFGLVVASMVFSLIASIKASEGVLYRYPLTLRLVA